MRHIAHKQLDRKLAGQGAAAGFRRPAQGWIRTIREALGMTTTQLAQRLSLSQPSVVNMEKSEQRDATSLETLRRAAAALDCELVYALVPKTSLEETLRTQARKKAKARLERAGHSMRLENQAVSKEAMKEEYERLVDDLMRGNLRRLWDET